MSRVVERSFHVDNENFFVFLGVNNKIKVTSTGVTGEIYNPDLIVFGIGLAATLAYILNSANMVIESLHIFKFFLQGNLNRIGGSNINVNFFRICFKLTIFI
jgi:hypothetical protein